MSAETWLPVAGWEGLYEVSDAGRVRSLPRVTTSYGGRTWNRQAKILHPTPNGTGHLAVTLKVGDAKQFSLVHRLVLTAFGGPAPEGTECCHGNGDPADNRLSNLRWDTRLANVADRRRHGNDYFANRDECSSGHAYTPANTRLTSRGHRICRTCKREWAAAKRAHLRSAA